MALTGPEKQPGRAKPERGLRSLTPQNVPHSSHQQSHAGTTKGSSAFQQGPEKAAQQGEGKGNVSSGSPFKPSPKGETAPGAHSPTITSDKEAALDADFKVQKAEAKVICDSLKRTCLERQYHERA